MVSKKFTDEDDAPVAVRVHQEIQKRDAESSAEERDEVSSQEDEDSSSDDEAPEEEAVSTGAQSVKELENARLKVEREQKALEKAKRREQSLKYQLQQEEKKAKNLEKAEENETPSQDEDDIPDFLPDELLEDVEMKTEESKSKYINFNEDPREIRKALKKQRLQQLKMLQKLQNSSVKKGPVTVKVLGSGGKVVNNKKILSVPVGEAKVINKKDKWLKRKSLGKQRV